MTWFIVKKMCTLTYTRIPNREENRKNWFGSISNDIVPWVEKHVSHPLFSLPENVWIKHWKTFFLLFQSEWETEIVFYQQIGVTQVLVQSLVYCSFIFISNFFLFASNFLPEKIISTCKSFAECYLSAEFVYLDVIRKSWNFIWIYKLIIICSGVIKWVNRPKTNSVVFFQILWRLFHTIWNRKRWTSCIHSHLRIDNPSKKWHTQPAVKCMKWVLLEPNQWTSLNLAK